MATSRTLALLFLLLIVASEIGTIDAKKVSKHAKKTINTMVGDKEKEKEETKRRKRTTACRRATSLKASASAATLAPQCA
ncbi:unnamed protein product [Urochloa humidicola]